MSNLNILLVAEESAGIQLLRAVHRLNHNIIAVLASPAKDTLDGATVWNVAANYGYPTWPSDWVKDPFFADRVREAEVDLILNVHSLYIIADEVLDAPRIGSFNLHPGPLPEYAGLNSASWALYNGEITFGVTLHKMVSKIDAGHIVSQRRFSIEENDNAISLVAKSVKLGIPLVLNLIEQAEEGLDNIHMEPQDHSEYRYYGSKVPGSGFLDWSKSALEVTRFIRACDYSPFNSPWGHPMTRLNGVEISILKAALTDIPSDQLPGTIHVENSNQVFVACQDQWIRVLKVRANGSQNAVEQVLIDGSILENRPV